MNILLTGSSGSIGKDIKKILEKETNFKLFSISNKFVNLKKNKNVFYQDLKNKIKLTKRIDVVIHCANKHYNSTGKGNFYKENIQIAKNINEFCNKNKVKKLIFLGSSCIYPKFCDQPIMEEYLLNGPLEPTNEPYAIAKIAGIKMCENYYRQYNNNFISLMPTNLYGPNDNYDLNTSHVMPALIRKFYEAKLNKSNMVEIWGTGEPLREFLHVDDLADAVIFTLLNIESKLIYDHLKISHINIGSGEEISIKDLAFLIKKNINPNAKILFNNEMPNGTPRKLLDVSKINKLGWKRNISLKEGIRMTIESYIKECQS